MRDNPYHGAVILGGMFGAKMPALGAKDQRKVEAVLHKEIIDQAEAINLQGVQSGLGPEKELI